MLYQEQVCTLTEYGQLLVCLQGLLPGEGDIKPAGSGQVYLHGAAKDLHIGWSPLDGLSAHLHPHARHHHRTVVVDRFHSESPRLDRNMATLLVKVICLTVKTT